MYKYYINILLLLKAKISPQNGLESILAELVLQIFPLWLQHIGALESKFKARYHGGVVCSSCMHTACSSMYFGRAAAVHTTSQKQMYATGNAAFVLLQQEL